MKNENYKKLIFFFIATGVAVLPALIVSWFFDQHFDLTNLLIGSLILFFSVFFFFTSHAKGRIITIMGTALAAFLYMYVLLSWSIEKSLLIGLGVFILMLLGYMSL